MTKEKLLNRGDIVEVGGRIDRITRIYSLPPRERYRVGVFIVDRDKINPITDEEDLKVIKKYIGEMFKPPIKNSKDKSLSDVRTFITTCPMFFGFYGTEAGSLLEDEIDRLLEEEGVSYDEIEFDTKGAMQEIASRYIYQVADAIKDFLGLEVEVKFIEVYSPPYYNFRNDSIVIEITIDVLELLNICNEHHEELDKYIRENFSHSSGFVSFVPNVLKDWLYAIEHKTDRWELMVSELLTILLHGIEGVEEDYLTDFIKGNFTIDYKIIGNGSHLNRTTYESHTRKH